jgi:hypothetical protein
VVNAGAFATAPARARRHKRRRVARAREEWIRELLDGTDLTRAEAEAFVDDPGNQVLCERCGWTYNMICPECAEGCACSVGCDGWRHGEYRDGFDDYDDDPWGEHQLSDYDPSCSSCGEYLGGCECLVTVELQDGTVREL